jgi:caspase domain-containing protein/WD40 domain-containing protein
MRRRQKIWFTRACVCVVALALVPSLSADDDKPFLRLETGGHEAPITGIDVDAAGLHLVTGSEDKTVRVWSLQGDKLERVLRLPMSAGSAGQIDTVAISQNGETIAAAGWTGYERQEQHNIYLFERQTGRLLRRILGSRREITSLVFSRDGARLAMTDLKGIRVFRVSDGQELWQDSTYRPAGHHGVDFDADGQFATSGDDGQIRLYSPDLKILIQVKAPGGKAPEDIAFSPDGGRIAVGYQTVSEPAPRVDILSGKDLRLLYSANTRRAGGSLVTVAWSTDGTVLYAAGSFPTTSIRRWAEAGRGSWQDLKGTELVTAIRPLPDGRLAVAASREPAWGLVDAKGTLLLKQRPGLAEFDRLGEGFRVGPDGKTILFAYESGGKRPALFKLPGRRLIFNPAPDASLQRRIAPPSLKVQSLTAEGHWEVQVTADGRLAVAPFGDGTIRWYRYNDGKELLAFFPHADGQRWVLWTPSGYYDTSAGGEDLIGWYVNHGPDHEADFLPVRDPYHHPEVIDLVLDTLDETEALRRAGVTLPSTLTVASAPSPPPIASRSLPVVTVLEPASGAAITTSPVKLRLNIHSPSGARVTAVLARIDGLPIVSRGGEGEVVFQPEAPTPSQNFYQDLEIPVPPKDCVVEILAEADGATSEPARLQLHWASSPPKHQRRLFVLAVGISKYKNPAFKLDYADQDATDVAAAWKRLGDGSYDNVETHVLVNDQATHNTILEVLEELKGKTTSDDVTVVFLAGHGINDSGYYFLPYDADLQRQYNTLLPGSFLQNSLLNLKGRVVLFLDTCRAGSLQGTGDELRRRVDASNFLNDLIYNGSAGVVVFSAASGQQLSIESTEWKHGAFTKVLLEGLAGAADLTKDGTITPSELGAYLQENVEKLTHGAQTPVANKSSNVPDFVLARVPSGK